jgi:hypothetical protein
MRMLSARVCAAVAQEATGTYALVAESEGATCSS